MYTCVRCNTSQPIPRNVATRQATRCMRCGAVHSVLGREVDIISPPMAPLGTLGRVSPWMLPWTRPVTLGDYECRFEDIRIRLYWDGRRFTWRGTPVAMQTFTSWRGVWT